MIKVKWMKRRVLQMEQGSVDEVEGCYNLIKVELMGWRGATT